MDLRPRSSERVKSVANHCLSSRSQRNSTKLLTLRSRCTEMPSSRAKLPKVKLQNTSKENTPPIIQAPTVALHVSQLSEVVGREDEISKLNEFILPWVNEGKNGSLYISGAPGTGKTATVTQLVGQLTQSRMCKSIHVNCMTLTTPRSIYSSIFENLTQKTLPVSSPDVDKAVDCVEKAITAISKHTPLVIVLDEIDQLASRFQDVLYTIFGWPESLVDAHVILIGIANALDLTERLLPHLRARSIRPLHVAFPPYSKEQIIKIITYRLTGAREGSEPALDNLAVQFCAKKVAASSGDIRKALAICQRALELAQLEAKSTDKADSSAERPPLTALHLTPLQQRIMASPSVRMSLRKRDPVGSKVGKSSVVPGPIIPNIRHISQAIKESQSAAEAMIGGRAASTPGGGGGLPLHHKLVLASLLLLRRLKKQRESTLAHLHQVYSYVCSRRDTGLVPLAMADFVSVCDLLETHGLLRFSTASSGLAKTRKVALLLDDRGVERSLDDDLLLSSILAVDSVP